MAIPIPSLTASSSAAARSGNVGGSGERAYGGINIQSGSGGFEIPQKTIIIAVGVAALFLFAKNKRYI